LTDGSAGNIAVPDWAGTAIIFRPRVGNIVSVIFGTWSSVDPTATVQGGARRKFQEHERKENKLVCVCVPIWLTVLAKKAKRKMTRSSALVHVVCRPARNISR
jgi:hypothetical protein